MSEIEVKALVPIERLEQLIGSGDPTSAEVHDMSVELINRRRVPDRKAEPVAWTSAEQLASLRLPWYAGVGKVDARTRPVPGYEEPLYAYPPYPQPVSTAPIEAARDVLAERERQKAVEGWTPEHDDTHSNGEMARAAAAYAIGLPGLSGSVQFGKKFRPWRTMLWPWNLKCWKPSDRRRDLVKAGALILAEIERLDRAADARKDEK